MLAVVALLAAGIGIGARLTHVSRALDPSIFRGKIVFVGATAPSLQDIHATPTSSVMSSPELQANATATALEGVHLTPAGSTLDTLMIVLLGVTVPLAAMRFTRLRSLLATLAIEVLYVAAVQLAFDHGLVLDLVDPLLALLVATLGSLAVLYLAATVERERTRALFARFVPGAVVDQVMARADENLRLGAVDLRVPLGRPTKWATGRAA